MLKRNAEDNDGFLAKDRFQDWTELGDDDERENAERAESPQLACESLVNWTDG